MIASGLMFPAPVLPWPEQIAWAVNALTVPPLGAFLESEPRAWGSPSVRWAAADLEGLWGLAFLGSQPLDEGGHDRRDSLGGDSRVLGPALRGTLVAELGSRLVPRGKVKTACCCCSGALWPDRRIFFFH